MVTFQNSNPLGFLGSSEHFLRRWGIWVLLLFAILYYGQYYRAGLYPAAEGGVEGMVALRLLEGQRPIADTFLGYNLLWFYPVVALFKVFGPSYTALRIFFFFLCTLTGLISFRLVQKCTRCARVAFLAGLLVLVIPGQMFRNYMAFLVVLNMTTLLSAFVLPLRKTIPRLLWMAASGVTLAIAWLIRVDVGFFLSCIWLGLVLTYPIRSWGMRNYLPHAGVTLAGVLLAVTLFLLLHLPFYLDASRRGFVREFAGQYEQWPSLIQSRGRDVIGTVIKSASGILVYTKCAQDISVPTPKPTEIMTPPIGAVSAKGGSGERKPLASLEPAKEAMDIKAEHATLSRRSFTSDSARDRMMAINLHLPILISALLGVTALIGWFIALRRSDEKLRVQSLMLLTCLGCSLTLFPQYFFWRPDMVHLSEFMVPMTLTILIACFLMGREWMIRRGMLRLSIGIFLLFASLTLVLYYINACQSQASGGIAASLNKRIEFHAANGVNVRLTPAEFADASAITRIITAVSSPGEYLVCYPYNPEINFMTDRPSYEYNFYIDNVMVSAERFHRETLGKIELYRPVAFVITNWEVNNTEYSQFKNWAAKTYTYISENYHLAYRHGNVEVFVRPDRVSSIPSLTVKPELRSWR